MRGLVCFHLFIYLLVLIFVFFCGEGCKGGGWIRRDGEMSGIGTYDKVVGLSLAWCHLITHGLEEDLLGTGALTPTNSWKSCLLSCLCANKIPVPGAGRRLHLTRAIPQLSLL